MRFHEKDRDSNPGFFQQFQVLCGIEEEFLLIDDKGILVEKADEVMREAARLLQKDPGWLDSLKVKISGLDAEPSPAQIEYVTLPLPPASLETAIRAGRNLLVTAAKQIGVKVLAQS